MVGAESSGGSPAGGGQERRGDDGEVRRGSLADAGRSSGAFVVESPVLGRFDFRGDVGASGVGK